MHFDPRHIVSKPKRGQKTGKIIRIKLVTDPLTVGHPRHQCVFVVGAFPERVTSFPNPVASNSAGGLQEPLLPHSSKGLSSRRHMSNLGPSDIWCFRCLHKVQPGPLDYSHLRR